MRVVCGVVLKCLTCFLAALLLFAATAAAEGATALGGTGQSPLESPLVVPEAQSLLGGQGTTEAEEVRRNSPEAVLAREESQTKYEGLSAEEAVKLAGEVFPEVMDRPAGGLPQLPAGQTITGYPEDDAAQVDFGEGKRGVIESTEPIAVEGSSGQRVPVDLGLVEAGGGFQPVTPVVGVLIPKRLSEGVGIPGIGVSLTPVDGSGSPLGGSQGAVVGASVLYANTQTDTDLVAKPTTYGFATDTLLRSVKSPQQLYFRVGVPEDASVVQAKGGSGVVEVLEGGTAIATIFAPSAVDAAGTDVPVSMSLSGDTLTLTVEDHPGEYQFPIQVDPEVWDSSLSLYEPYNNWVFGATNYEAFHSYQSYETNAPIDIDETGASYTAGQYAFLEYPTQGESHIFRFVAKTKEEDPSSIGTSIRIESPGGGKESSEVPLPASGEHETPVCVSTCSLEAVTEKNKHNGAFLEDYAKEKGSGLNRSTVLLGATVEIGQEKGPSVALDTADSTVEGIDEYIVGTNALYSGRWVSNQRPERYAIAIKASDPGIGVKAYGLKSPSKSGWGLKMISDAQNECSGVQCNECFGLGEVCAREAPSSKPLVSYLSELGELPEGEDMVEGTVEDGVGLQATGSATIKVDNASPHGIKVLGLGSGNEISESAHVLVVEATDGSGSTPSSGIKSIAVSVDGRELGKPSGPCPKGPCTARWEWEINGSEFGAGEHKLKVTATDNAGNVAKEEITFKVRHATPVSVGPGYVDPQSGELTLGATDVSIAAPGASLEVVRSYGSRHLTAGSEGPLGPQWSLSVGGQESITKLPDGNATLTAANGGQTTFASNEKGAFVSPTGDANLALAEVKNEKGELTEYVLKDAATGAATHFTSLGGPTATLWKPAKQEGPLSSQAVRYIYQAKEGLTEPKYALAPEPSGLSFSCISKLEKSEKLEKGCRALEFVYAEKTKESIGENESEWGEYKGRLKEVVFVAYNPSAKEMTKTEVARYEYDKQGRLRAAWNPQISSALKTTYGYDTEGHVTALTPPGQESWVFTYGAIAGDPNTGRLLKATQAAASAKLWGGELPTKSEAPKITGTPIVGVSLSVSNGTWSNEPVAYAYQWEDCTAGICEKQIAGATNASYTPTTSDVGYELRVKVRATNGGGSVVANSATSRGVKAMEAEWRQAGAVPSEAVGTKSKGTVKLTDEGHGAWECEDSGEGSVGPGAVDEETKWTTSKCKVISGSCEQPMVIDAVNLGWHSELLTSEGTTHDVISTSGKGTPGFKVECEIDGILKVADECTGTLKTGMTNTAGGVNASFDGEKLKCSVGGAGKGSLEGTELIEATKGGKLEVIAPEWRQAGGVLSGAVGTKSKGTVKLTDEGSSAAWECEDSGEGSVGPGAVDEETKWTTSKCKVISGSCEQPMVIDAVNLGWHSELLTSEGTTHDVISTSGKGTPGFKVECEIGGILKVADECTGTLKTGMTNTAGGVSASFDGEKLKCSVGGAGKGSLEGSELIEATKGGRLSAFPVNELQSEPHPQPGWTLEYHLPVYGAGPGAPNLGREEVERWGQTDDPVEGMAILPPDKPQGWPASSYERATIDYLDEKGRTVNTSSPTGGVSATEYNAYNDVIRTLSPDNRLKAVTAGCKPKEECKYATESTFEEKGSEPGVELLSTLGPQHTVELGTKGAPMEARKHTVYSYNEGEATEGGPYHLVTTMSQGAEVAGKEESSTVRTTTMSYSGQSNLGWKLRRPTSVTTEPSRLKLVHATVYEPATGNVIEQRMPANSGGESSQPEYTTKFGSEGEGAEKLRGPVGDAIDSSGNVWVLDSLNNRLDEFSSTGTFIKAVGFGVNKGEAKYEVCTTSCRAGIAGSGEGEFKEPLSIAINQSTGNMYIAELGNERIQELNSKAEYAHAWGKDGTEHGQFQSPTGVAIEPGSGNVWVTDYGNNRVQEFSPEGTFKATYGTYGAGEEEFHYPISLAFSEGDLYVVDQGNNRVEELSTSGRYLAQFGSSGTGNGEFSTPYGIASDPQSGNLYVVDWGNNRVEEFSPSGRYLGKFGSKGSGNGQFSGPERIAISSTGDLYVPDDGNDRVEEFAPPTSGYTGAHDTQTIYYTAGLNAMVASCGEHPEWANLPCQTQPLAQPEDSAPNLPVTTFTYNNWDEPEKTTETVGSTTRTTTDTYDSAGRLKTSTTTSTVGTALPIVTDEYNKETGALETQSTTTSGKTKTITSIYNKLGQLESYTDAAEKENKATYEYDIDGRIKKITGEKGTETYTYSETTGLLTELLNEYGTSKLAFTATYDPEGNLVTEGYPNAMTAKYTYNTVGKPTGLEYKKENHCATKCPETWFSDSVTPSIQGQWLTQEDTLADVDYTYDETGRLTQVEETPLPIHEEPECKHHGYIYDEDTNRTGMTIYTDDEGGYCVSGEGGTTEHHTYDSADRLIDTGVSYNTFGDITSLPAQSSEDPALTSTYYVDNQVESQKQKKQTINYTLDPAGRTFETISSGEPNNSDIISHYTGPGNDPAWTINPVSGEWQRNITGINGTLAAIQNNGETPELQLTDLHGDIIAKAYLSETATALAGKANTTEFGVPAVSAPAKYSWLGAIGLPTELPSGVISMGVRSYIPQLGRFLQPDPIPGGSANAYSYTFGDPINSNDPTGEYSAKAEAWAYSGSASVAAEGVEARRAEIAAEQAAARAAEEKAAEESAAREQAAWQAYEANVAAGWATYDKVEEELSSGESEEEGGYSGGAITDHSKGCWTGAHGKQECESNSNEKSKAKSGGGGSHCKDPTFGTPTGPETCDADFPAADPPEGPDDPDPMPAPGWDPSPVPAFG